MDVERMLRQRLESLRREGRYRVFADVMRRRGGFPVADHFAADGPREVTVWCYSAGGHGPGRVLAIAGVFGAAFRDARLLSDEIQFGEPVISSSPIPPPGVNEAKVRAPEASSVVVATLML